MTPRTIILVVAALLMAGATIFFADGYLSRQRAELEALRNQPVKEEAETQILVAKKSLPAGLFLKPEDVDWRPWPKEGVAPTYYVKGKVDKPALIGSVVRRGIAAGEPIAEGQVVKPGDRGFLAAVLNPGMRAITVSINQTSGVAGFVFPGDRVDLLLTVELDAMGVEGGNQKRYASETVLTSVRVLATDQRYNDIESSPKVSKTVTIEVTPKQAEMVSVATRLGRLALALRSLNQDEELRDDSPAMTAVASGGSTEATKASARTGGEIVMSADEVDSRPPERGVSVTFDSETSRLVGPRSDMNKVVVIRGAKSEAVKTDRGGVASSSSLSDGGDGEASEDAESSTHGETTEGGASGGDASSSGVATGADSSTTDLLKRGRL